MNTAHEVQIFFDGDCPLCVREINLLRKMDRRGRIEFTDIAQDGFDPTPLGKTMTELMDHIHGRLLPEGRWIEGVEVFRRVYSAVGLGPLVSLTRVPGIEGALDRAYNVFAKNRLKWTGRCDDGACQIESHA